MSKSRYKDYSIFFINGDEEYKKDKLMLEIRDCILPELTMSGFDYYNYDYNTVSYESFEAALKQYPMGNMKLIILTQFDIRKGKKEEQEETSSGNLIPELILEFAEEPFEETKLIIKTARDLPETNKLLKVLKKDNRHFYEREKQPYKNQLEGELFKIARSFKKNISEEAIEGLILLKGESLEVLGKAVEELVMYIGDKKTIEFEDVENMFVSTRIEEVFDIFDYFVNNDIEKVLSSLHNKFNLERNPAPEMFIGGMFFSIKKMIKLRSLLANNYSTEDISKLAGINKYFLRTEISKAKKFAKSDLIRLIRKLKDLDIDTKYNRKYSLYILEKFFVSEYDLRNIA